MSPNDSTGMLSELAELSTCERRLCRVVSSAGAVAVAGDGQECRQLLQRVRVRLREAGHHILDRMGCWCRGGDA